MNENENVLKWKNESLKSWSFIFKIYNVFINSEHSKTGYGYLNKN